MKKSSVVSSTTSAAGSVAVANGLVPSAPSRVTKNFGGSANAKTSSASSIGSTSSASPWMASNGVSTPLK